MNSIRSWLGSDVEWFLKVQTENGFDERFISVNAIYQAFDLIVEWATLFSSSFVCFLWIDQRSIKRGGESPHEA